VRAQQLADGVLSPVRVVVPNVATEDYVRLAIARTFGVAGNLEMLRLTTFAGAIVERVFDAHLAGAEVLESMALTLLLDDEFLSLPELVPVREYVLGGSSRDSQDLRRQQLAARIGRLFEEYTYSRESMLEGWRGGRFSLGADLAETEAWQKRLWESMFGAGGLARRRRLMALHEAVAAWPTVSRLSEGEVHVFGFAHFAPAFHEFLARLARDCSVAVYSVSPCEGFWEDIDATDPAPLHLWGRAGREQVRALNAISGFDHDDIFVEPEGHSLLAELQRDLLKRKPDRRHLESSFAFDGDDSVCVLEHAGVRRELEAVASEIWTAIDRDPSLRFDDIAVLLPDAEASTYLAHLGSVFHEAHDIPFHAVDLLGAATNGPFELALRILALPFGRFTRKEILGVVLHPSIAGVGFDRNRLLSWCQALGIAHGASRADHEGTYLNRDHFNWDQGLRRLGLGAFMAGDTSGAREPFELGGNAYAPLELAPSEMRDAAEFGLLVRSLLSDVRALRDSVLSMKDWAALLGAMVETYVAPRQDSDIEPLSRCLQQVRSIGAYDLGDKPVPYRIAFELVRSRIAQKSARRGGEGVLISGLTSSRPVPARILFLCGLGEDGFPGADASDPLDLRSAARFPGDASPRDRDRYAFLECLLGARDRFFVSYVSREPLTGDPLAPSPVVQELLDTLGRGYVRDPSSLVRRHPLRRWDESYFPNIGAEEPSKLGPMCIDEALAEANTVSLRRSAEAAGASLVTPDLVRLCAKTEPAWASFAEHLRLLPVEPVERTCEDRITISIRDIVKFLLWPLQGWGQFCVGLQEVDVDDSTEREDEPFSTVRKDQTGFLREVWFEGAASGKPIETVYDAAVQARAFRGQGPTGPFADGERPEHLGTLTAWSSELEKNGIGGRARLLVHRFGPGSDMASSDEAHSPLRFDVSLHEHGTPSRRLHVDLVGRTSPMSANSEHFVTFRCASHSDKWDSDRSSVKAFVDDAVLVAAGVIEPAPFHSLLIEGSREKGKSLHKVFDSLSRDEAASWLARVVVDLLSGRHDAFFPCEAIFSRHSANPGGDLVPHLRAVRENLVEKGRSAVRSSYGPVPHPERYPIPEEPIARARAELLFGTYFAKRQDVE